MSAEKLKKGEEPKETNVAVEMTESQKEEFVKFMADKAKKEEAEANKPAPRMFQMILAYEHNVNGKNYRPGKVVVDEATYGHLAHYEGVRKEQEFALNTSNNRMFHIMQSGQITEVTKK